MVRTQENEYDDRNYRIVTKNYANGTLSETRHAYFTNQWQCVEERVGTNTTPDRQFAWGVRYSDDLVLRDRSVSGGTLNERLYAMQDANWNVTAVADSTGTVQERYEYDPYGMTTVLAPNFTVRMTSNFGWETTYCGYHWDIASGLLAVRNRYYHPRLGNWLTRDPIGEIGGFNLYRGYFVPNSTDPFGLEDPFQGNLLPPQFLQPGGPGRGCAACHPVQPWVRTPQPTLQDLVRQATPDVRRAVEACQGDPNCLRALGDVFQQIASTPDQGFYNQTPDKCFRWLDDFLKNYPDYDPTKDPKISLGGGSLVLEPLDLSTRGGQSLVTSRSAFGRPTGSMTGHGVVRVTFNPAGGTPSTGYFDLGSSTHLGNYGGADHWFWPNTPGLGFKVEMDIENPLPFTPTRTPPRPAPSSPRTPSPSCPPRRYGTEVIPIGTDPSSLPPPRGPRVFE